MSNRIQPTHFIEVWKCFEEIQMNSKPRDIKIISESIRQTSFMFRTYTIALFLIRLKTPQEQANSIYYPKPKTI